MKNLVIKWLVGAISALFAAYVLPGIFISDFKAALGVALVMAFLNAVVRPLLVMLTIPATVISFGLFLLVINAAMVLLADYLLDDFRVASFWSALFFSMVMSLVSGIVTSVLRTDRILDEDEE